MRCIIYCVLTAGMIMTSGCGSGGGFPVSPTRGRVLCDGQPVPYVRVFFEPLTSGDSALAGKQGLATADENGNFVVSTYGTNDGAVIGKHRVRVGAPDLEAHPNFACSCVTNPELDIMQVEVKADGSNEFQLKLTKKSGRENLSLDEMEAIEDARVAARAKRRPTD